MIIAVKANNLGVVEKLINSRYNVYYNYVYKTLVTLGNLDIIKVLILDGGASYQLILLEAIKTNKLDIVKLLIENFNNPDIKMSMNLATRYKRKISLSICALFNI